MTGISWTYAMHIETSGTAKIRDSVSGQVFEIENELLDWDAVSADDEPMGDRVQWRAEVEHTVLGALAWILWEYPAGWTDHTEEELNGHDLIQNFEIRLIHDDDSGELDKDDGRPDIEWSDIPLNDQVEQMVEWFNTNFEDPQNEMPYADKESDENYDYIWGGPYDAEEELSAEFEGRASEAAIKAAVEAVTSDGTFDWAPTSEHPDRRRLEAGSYEEPDDFDDDDEEGDIGAVVKIPDQLPGPLVTFERDGKVARLPPGEVTPAAAAHQKIRASGHTAIIEALDDFEEGYPAHNHPGLRRALDRLRSSLGATIEALDVIRVGAAAERLNQYALRSDDIFTPEMAADVSALNVITIANLTRFPEWVDYRYGLDIDPEPTDNAIDAARKVVDVLVQTDVLEDEVKDELQNELLPFILPLEGDRGSSVERKTLFRSLSNAISTTASMVVNYVKIAGDKLKEGHFDAFKDIGRMGTLAVFTLSSGALTVLAAEHVMFAFLVPFLKFVGTVLTGK